MLPPGLVAKVRVPGLRWWIAGLVFLGAKDRRLAAGDGADGGDEHSEIRRPGGEGR